MKINQLSKISGVNPETIRMYRNQGLLSPRQLENGYYDYSLDDFRNLLHIRKMRGAGLGLDNIEYMYSHDDQSELYDAMQEEYRLLEARIEELKRQQFMLKLTMDHFKLYRDDPSEIVELEVTDDSYSIFMRDGVMQPELIDWVKNINFMTQSIRIPPEQLLAPTLPEELPMEIGIGSYKAVLIENNIPIPDCAVCIPKGKYLTMWITPETDRSIKRAQIVPLLRYADRHGYRLTGDTTAFMYRVDISGGETKFIYRFRARYE